MRGNATLIGCVPNRFTESDSPFVNGVAVPRGTGPVQVASTGLTIRDLPETSAATWDYIRPDPCRDQGTTVVGDIDYAHAPHTLLALHANKAVTFDLKKVREITGYGAIRLRAHVCYGGRPEPAVDAAVYLDGVAAVPRRALTREGFAIDVAIPAEAEFLTLMATDQNGDIAFDQVFFGDAVLIPDGSRPATKANELQKAEVELSALRKKVAEIEQQIVTSLSGNASMRGLVLDPASIGQPVLDTSARPDGLALPLRAWSPGRDRSTKPDISLKLTEFADPAGELTYFLSSDEDVGVEDELLVR
jgi:hypothetical protein